MSVDFVQAGTQFGIGVIVGAVLGFTSKKVLKLMVFFGGLAVVGVIALDHTDIYSVDRELVDTFTAVSVEEEVGVARSLLFDFVSTVPIGLGFLMGGLFGFKRA